MKRRFIVCVHGTPAQETEFKDLLKASPAGWWHWMKGFWLMADSTGLMTAASVRDMVKSVYQSSDCVVIELQDGGGDTWAGLKTAGREKMFDWFRNTWKPPKT